MVPARPGLARRLCLPALLLGLWPCLGQAQIQRFGRGAAAYQRDQRRVARTPLVRSLADLLTSRSAFSGKRPATGSWNVLGEGSSTFSVDVGRGCTLVGSVQRYCFPGIDVNVARVEELSLVRGGRRARLLDGNLPVNIGFDTAFYYGDKGGHVRWHGPSSVFSLVALFHELDHLKQYEAMTDAERQRFCDIYDRKSDARPLSPEQKRIMVGFERHAWAFALRQMRQLGRQGFDLLGGVAPREILDTIYGCLKNYYDYQGKPAGRRGS